MRIKDEKHAIEDVGNVLKLGGILNLKSSKSDEKFETFRI